MTPTEIALGAFAALFISFDPEAAERLLAPDYIQHNPGVPTGAAPLLGFIPALKESRITATTHRVIAEGDMVVLHNTYQNAQIFGAEALVAFDVFRIEGGRVVEHWDNLAPVAAPNPSGRTQVDGPSAVGDREKTAANKELVAGFVETVLMRGEGERIADYVSPEIYRQHNSGIADGLDGLGAALSAMAAAGVTMSYETMHLIVAEGDFVFTASEGRLGDTPTAFFDLFRVEDGRIVEHWDVIAEIPAAMAHENGKF